MAVTSVIRRVYNKTIRERLPEKDRTLADVVVRDTPLFDLTADNPRYKIGFILAIHDNVSEGDTAEIVGFGRGVSTVHTLRAGAESVIAYEAAQNMIEIGEQTIERNVGAQMKDVEIENAVVGEPIDVYGNFNTASSIPPGQLASGDVLILDCEGAEKDILANLGDYPDTIICETHPTKGAPPEDVIDILEGEYHISTRNHKLTDNPTKIVVGHRKR